nr:transcriptional regulator [Amycolatopsis sp.]
MLLVALLLRAGRTVATDDLIRYLWEDDSPGDARAALQVHMARLRARLGQFRADLARLIHTRPNGYSIEVQPESLDLARFEVAMTRARQEAEHGDAEAELEWLNQALSLFRGRPLDLVPSDSLLREEAPRLAEQRLHLIERRFEIELRRGNHREIVSELRSCVTENPLQERLCGQLMLALYRSGRQAEALEVFRVMVARLKDELGIDPQHQLVRLYRSMLNRAPELIAPAPQRSPEPARPEARTPASGHRWEVACQLPAEAGEFVGRADVRRRILALLSPERLAGSVPVISMSGSAGVGKTALAVLVAHQVRAQFPDGQWYVQMGGTSDNPRRPVAVLMELLRTSGLEGATLSDDLDTCAAIFRARLADRRVLLVFDDVHTAEQIQPLLPGTPGCAVIVTRRADLPELVPMCAAKLFPLDVLSAAESHTMLARMLGEQRVEAEPQAVAELIRLCARLPLALRVAAAHLATRPHQAVADYVSGLQRGSRLANLAIGGRPGTALRAAFDLSYRTLSTPVRRLFRMLGLVPGARFTVPLGAELAEVDQEQAQRMLDTLAGAHLVETDTAQHYRFHDLLRLYAVERSEEEDTAHERDEAVARLCRWYVHSAEAALRTGHSDQVRMPLPALGKARNTPGFADARSATEWLNSERGNLVALADYAADTEHRKVSIALADLLRGHFRRERHYADWLTVTNAGLRAARAGRDTYATAVMRYNLGLAYQGMSKPREAVEQLNAALADFRDLGAEDFESVALTASAMADLQSPVLRVDDALPKLDRGLRIAQRLGLRGVEAQTHRHLGIVNHARGRIRESLRNFLEADAIYRALGIEPPRAEILARLAFVHQELGRPADAAEHVAEAMAISRYFGARYDLAVAHQVSATGHALCGEYGEARQELAQALKLSREHGYVAVEVNSRNIGASLHRLEGRPDIAVREYRDTLAFAREIGHPQAEATSLVGLALACHDLADFGAAVEHARAALAVAGPPGMLLLQGKAWDASGFARRELGQLGQAAIEVDRAAEIYAECGYELDLPRIRDLQRQLRRELGMAAAASPA